MTATGGTRPSCKRDSDMGDSEFREFVYLLWNSMLIRLKFGFIHNIRIYDDLLLKKSADCIYYCRRNSALKQNV